MTMNFCCNCDKEFEKTKSCRQSKSNKHQFKTRTKTMCYEIKILSNTKEKSHKIQLKIEDKIKDDDCIFYIRENILENLKKFMDSFRHLKSKRHQLKTRTKTQCDKLKNLYKTKETSHKIQLNIEDKKKYDVCYFYT